MKREENPGGSQIVSLAVMAAVAYFGYQYLVSSGLWAQWFGGTAASGGGGTLAQQIAAGLQSGAFVHVGADAAGNIIVHQVSTGAYYAVNPTSGAVTQASGPGTVGTQPVTTVPITQPNPVALPPATSQLATQLQSDANQYMANMQAAGTPVAGLNVDEWIFYYQLRKGVTLSGGQDDALLQAAGVNPAARSTTIIPLQTFMNALGGVGLSGIVSVPNNGPITAPLPTSQNFNRGYGGYPGGRREMRKGYLN